MNKIRGMASRVLGGIGFKSGRWVKKNQSFGKIDPAKEPTIQMQDQDRSVWLK